MHDNRIRNRRGARKEKQRECLRKGLMLISRYTFLILKNIQKLLDPVPVFPIHSDFNDAHLQLDSLNFFIFLYLSGTIDFCNTIIKLIKFKVSSKIK